MSVWVEMRCGSVQCTMIVVTLHVSVWVEILCTSIKQPPNPSRSTWACELKSYYSIISCLVWLVTLHVSVWVEIFDIHSPSRVMAKSRSTWACELKFPPEMRSRLSLWSRSTWACELKSQTQGTPSQCMSHAPRERVSWNTRDVHAE